MLRDPYTYYLSGRDKISGRFGRSETELSDLSIKKSKVKKEKIIWTESKNLVKKNCYYLVE